MRTVSSPGYVDLKRSLYREYSRSYDEDRRQFVSAQALAYRIKWALESLESGQHVLDLGCGSGELLLEAARHTQGNAALLGLDITPEMLALARTRAGPDAGLIEANALDGLPFQDRSFHLVTSLNLVQELPASAIPGLLAEVRRVLKPGGAFKAIIPCIEGNNPSSRLFRELAIRCGAMDFLFAEDLENLLREEPCLVHKEFQLSHSSAASASASGATRFKFFTRLMEEIQNQGLDPAQVQQGVLFFTGRRDFVKQA
jgi:ubiquinone/menaquinone biosynthesis C-methylase UbiE